MSKHTPGPWFVSPAAVEGREDVFCSEREGTIAQNARPADAALIAAAPEMLDLLKWTLGTLEGPHPEGVSAKNLYGDRLRGIIAKAEGK